MLGMLERQCLYVILTQNYKKFIQLTEAHIHILLFNWFLNIIQKVGIKYQFDMIFTLIIELVHLVNSLRMCVVHTHGYTLMNLCLKLCLMFCLYL